MQDRKKRCGMGGGVVGQSGEEEWKGLMRTEKCLLLRYTEALSKRKG